MTSLRKRLTTLFLLSLASTTWTGIAFHVSSVALSAKKIHLTKSVALYNGKDSSWSSWDDESFKGESTDSLGAPDPSTWINEPPDYINSGDTTKKSKKASVSSQSAAMSIEASSEDSRDDIYDNSDAVGDDADPSEEAEEALSSEEKLRPAPSSLFVTDEPGSLVPKSNPWDNLSPDRVASNIMGGTIGERGEPGRQFLC